MLTAMVYAIQKNEHWHVEETLRINSDYSHVISGCPLTPTPNNAIYESSTKPHEATVRKGILRSKTKISIAVVAAVVAVVIPSALFNHYNHSPTNSPPTAQYALTNKGLALDNLGNYTGAILYYDKALAIDPKYEDALYYKGDALNNLGNYTQAIQYLDKALAIDPNGEYALNDRGWALNGLGNYTGAITYFDEALKIDPNYKWALYNKGDALDSRGKHAEAIQYFDKALAIDPKFEYALSNKGGALSSVF